MSISHIARKPSSGNTGIVPPWLEHPDPNVPHTWDEIEQRLNAHGWTEFRADEFPVPPNDQETPDDDDRYPLTRTAEARAGRCLD